MKILAIVGSPRLRGNTNYLVDEALKEAAKLGAQTEKIMLTKHRLNPCRGHDGCASFTSCRQKDDGVWILDKFCEADGVILATPVYYYNVSAQMKVFIDRNYFLYKHDRKCGARAVGIIVVAEQEGIKDTLHTLRRFIDSSLEVTEDGIFIASGYASKAGDARKNPSLAEEARRLGRKMVAKLQEMG